jgi:hypothetical protein
MFHRQSIDGRRSKLCYGEGSWPQRRDRRRSWRESDGVIGALRPGSAGAAKDPDFWCAFDDGEVKVIGDEPANTIEDRSRRRAKESYAPQPRADSLVSVSLTVIPVGEPAALVGHVRFDERGMGNGALPNGPGYRPSSPLPVSIPYAPVDAERDDSEHQEPPRGVPLRNIRKTKIGG